MEWVVKRSGSTASDTITESVIRLRGLPFGCSKEEIAHFFTGNFHEMYELFYAKSENRFNLN